MTSDSVPKNYRTFEAVVVGSGFGGAITACRLVEAGIETCIIERGRRYGAKDFPAVPPAGDVLPDPARWVWGRDQGLWDMHHLGELQAVGAAGYGGGSLIYANVHLRAPREVLKRWPVGREELDPYYDLVSHMLDLQSVDDLPGGLPFKTQQFDMAAEKLKRRTIHPPLAVHFGDTGHGLKIKNSKLQPCVACGACSSGCPHSSKNSLDHNYLTLAERPLPHPDGSSFRGAEVRTLCEVVQFWAPGHASNPLHQAHGYDGWAVEYRDHTVGGDLVVIGAGALFLCAGSVNDTELLMRNSERLVAETDRKSSSVFEKIGHGYFPNADTIAAVCETKNPQHPSWGPTISTLMAYHGGSGGERGSTDCFVVEDGGYDVAFKRLFGAIQGPLWLAGNRYDDRDGFPADERPAEVDGRQPVGTHLATVEACLGAAPVPPWQPPVMFDEYHRTLRQTADAALTPQRCPDGSTEPGWLISKLPVVLTHAVMGDLWSQVRAQATRVAVPLAQNTRRLILQDTLGACLGWLAWAPDLRKKLIDAGVRIGERCLDQKSGLSAESMAASAVEAAMKTGMLHDPVELAAQVLPWLLDYDEQRTADERGERVQLLLAMGRDESPWTLKIDHAGGGLLASPGALGSDQRANTFGLYEVQTRLMRDIAATLGGQLRTNPLWALSRKPITVHSAGGCAMGVAGADTPCDAYGRVRGTAGLYVNDGALFPSPVGVNPSHTIAALAERNIEEVLRSDFRRSEFSARQTQDARVWATWARSRGLALEVPQGDVSAPPVAAPIGIGFEECLTGFMHEAPSTGLSSRTAPASEYVKICRAGEDRGRSLGQSLTMSLSVKIPSLASFLDRARHRSQLNGEMRIEFGIDADGRSLPAVVGRVKSGSLDLFPDVAVDSLRVRTMRYLLCLEAEGGDWTLEGWKYLHDDPGPDLWEDTTALFVNLVSPSGDRWVGTMRLGMADLLETMLPGMRVMGTRDPQRIAWTMARFLAFFGHGLMSVYMPAPIRKALHLAMKELDNG